MESLIADFVQFFSTITKFLFLEWALGYACAQFYDFLEIFLSQNSKSYVVLQLVMQLIKVNLGGKNLASFRLQGTETMLKHKIVARYFVRGCKYCSNALKL